MSTRTLTLILAAVAAILAASWIARNHVARQRCEELGRTYEQGKGCVEPQKTPPIILERGLTRT